MHYQQWILLVVILVFGAGVIGSYIQGISANPGGAEKLWGGVAGSLRIINYVTMLLAVAGFFLFTYYLFFRTDPATAQVAGSLNFWVFIAIYSLILLPSAFWMPLTFNVLASHNTSTWFAVRAVLFIVGFASLALTIALLTLQPRNPDISYWLAVVGSILFCVQTLIMDAFIWAANFKY
jgi:uncharacterized membrane protein